ncbi:M50 family metallopeptidase [Thalassotalea euphylliae]|uniref:M50 family metallopeptidase n=1 Tax=Thalassotalea euphylliae TaxID=1655234 RepID=UPI00364540D1
MTVTRSPSFWNKHQFWLVLLAAAIIREVPFLSLPFNWFESFFHEISHGFAAILTGGKIIRIELMLNGAGLCTTLGGIRFFTAFAGYAGAALWGYLIFQLASYNAKLTKTVIALLLVLITVCLVLWTRDLFTLVILLVLATVLLAKLRFATSRWLNRLVQLLGLTILLNAVISPLYLVDGHARGDGATLANLTLIPELAWVAIWMAIGLLFLYALAKQHSRY